MTWSRSSPSHAPVDLNYFRAVKATQFSCRCKEITCTELPLSFCPSSQRLSSCIRRFTNIEFLKNKTISDFLDGGED